MPRSKGRHGRPFRRIRAQILAQGKPCWICRQPIDLTIPWRDPYTGAANPWSATIDHLQPLARGGDPLDPTNLAAAHRRCNIQRAHRLYRLYPTTSRRW
jgi:5-methylcytosine-specific restriction endonuclease McrA